MRIHEQGHLGARKTLRMFRERYQGKCLKKVCKQIISKCVGCQQGSDYRPRHTPSGQIESTSPWDVLSIDVMGPLPATDQQERFIA